MTFIDSDQAFEDAIEAGVLSATDTDLTYAGHYMYMGTDERRGHAFKSINFRTYLYMRDEHTTTRARFAMRETVGR
jgi:hypothetical protein